MNNEEYQNMLDKDSQLMNHYQNITPFLLIHRMNRRQLCYPIRAYFHKNTKIISFLNMDLDGFYRNYVHAEFFTPFKYEDLITQVPFVSPYMNFIDHDLVYRNSELK